MIRITEGTQYRPGKYKSTDTDVVLLTDITLRDSESNWYAHNHHIELRNVIDTSLKISVRQLVW